jgi:hypothetical protein
VRSGQAGNPKLEVRNEFEIPKKQCRTSIRANRARALSAFPLFPFRGDSFGFRTSDFGFPAQPARASDFR